MKIKSIQITNIGPYVGENKFDFNVSDSLRNMILIGGKNGAGKTTFFNAIKICLYGCVSYGFESNNIKYYAEVEKIINSNEKLKKSGNAEVRIKLLLDDGMFDNVYTFVRKWNVSGKRISESFVVHKNDEMLSETEKSDFESYLLHLLPPNLFRFYFFDGEKIGDFVFSGNKNTDFKDAFLKLCNLDTMEIIRDNFRRISKGKSNEGSDVADRYYDLVKASHTLTEKIEDAEKNRESITYEIINIDEQLTVLEKEYAKGGGISKKEWHDMHDQILKEETKREETRKWLKDAANNTLPFIILRQELENLRGEIEIEHKAQKDASMKESINSPEIESIIENVLDNCGITLSEDIAKKIIFEIINYAESTENAYQILNLSDFDRFELTAKINNLLSFDVGRIGIATDNINKSLNSVKNIRKKMERSSVENYEEYLKRKSDLNERKSKISKDLVDIERILQSLRDDRTVVDAKREKSKGEYENILKKRSINDISARALLAFDELQDVLYINSIKMVEENFKKFFAALINKSNLIDGIHVDESLNVLPYKNKTFYAIDIKKSIEKNGIEDLVAQIGMYAYEILQEKLKLKEVHFELPVEVKQQLSAGEKQIFIMALYQTLSQLNKINVPYIIDTPFARIDKGHRANILEQFFKKLNGQVIILSTDEEIVGNYYQVISNVISNEFVLQHTDTGNTQIMSNTYFGGNV